MPTGPLITTVTAGSALSVTDINANFAALQAFLAAIPTDQLAQYKTDVVHQAEYPTVLAAGTTRAFGYQKIESGGYSLEPVMLSLSCQLSSNALVSNLVLTAETSPGLGSTGVWTVKGTVTLTAANTANGDRNDFDTVTPTYAFGVSAALSAVTIADGSWLRFKLASAGGAITASHASAVLTSKLRIRG